MAGNSIRLARAFVELAAVDSSKFETSVNQVEAKFSSAIDELADAWQNLKLTPEQIQRVGEVADVAGLGVDFLSQSFGGMNEQVDDVLGSLNELVSVDFSNPVTAIAGIASAAFDLGQSISGAKRDWAELNKAIERSQELTKQAEELNNKLFQNRLKAAQEITDETERRLALEKLVDETERDAFIAARNAFRANQNKPDEVIKGGALAGPAAPVAALLNNLFGAAETEAQAARRAELNARESGTEADRVEARKALEATADTTKDQTKETTKQTKEIIEQTKATKQTATGVLKLVNSQQKFFDNVGAV